MQIEDKDVLHIAKLARLKLADNELENYKKNLQEILDFAEVVNKADVENLDITIGANEEKNVFRKDEVKIFENHEGLMANAPEKERDMFKIPKVIS